MQHHQGALRSCGGGHDDEDEHVVYYDLDAGSRQQNSLLFSPEDARKNATAKRANAKSKSAASRRGNADSAGGGNRAAGHVSEILQRPKEIFHHQPPFQLDAEDDDHESEDENPFASLLQQPQRKPQPVDASYEDDSDYATQTASPSDSQLPTFPRAPAAQMISQAKPIVPSRKSTSPVRVTPPRHANSTIISPGDSTATSVLRRERSAKPSAAAVAAPKRLSVEAADARPSRWSQKSLVSAAAMKKAASRRKSVPNALQRKREAQTGGPRRFSLPLAMMESQWEEETSSQSERPKRQRLADVLMRATLASQQKTQDDERPSQQDTSHDSFAMENDDVIVDTEHQMREEKFETQIFSPSKLHNPSLARKKQQLQKLNAAAVASKIRGELGEAVARAIRKTTRDLTMLHSHGQTLIEQSRETTTSAGLDRVQDRDHTVIRLRRHRQSQSQQQQESSGNLMVYDASIHTLSPEVQAPCKEKARVRVAFSSQAASQLKLKPNALVKIYAPFHFIPLAQPAGSSNAVGRSSKWLLVGTTLSEVITG